jgi:alanine racemase
LNSTVVEISLSALRHNLRQVARRVGTASIIAIVKANAYGHGVAPVARTLLEAGAHQLGVATLAEGQELRHAGITAPILVLSGIFPEDMSLLQELNLTPVLPSRDAFLMAARLATSRSEPLPVHLKVDTGMSRLGLTREEFLDILRSDWPPTLRLEGLMSHLASADSRDPASAEDQLARFRELLDAAKATGLAVPAAHIANSAAILRFPASYFDCVRPGLMLYGYVNGPTAAADLRPALSWKTRIIQVKRVGAGQPVSYGGTFVTSRPSTLAILPVGYADGYSRALSNRGRVLVGGRAVPIVGRICMDLTVIDASALPDVRPGDEAVLLGRQGTAAITADELAAWQDTISYEVLCQISPRLPRVHLED